MLPKTFNFHGEPTLSILYKGCMNFKTRGIPYFFQNFDSFYVENPVEHPIETQFIELSP